MKNALKYKLVNSGMKCKSCNKQIIGDDDIALSKLIVTGLCENCLRRIKRAKGKSKYQSNLHWIRYVILLVIILFIFVIIV